MLNRHVWSQVVRSAPSYRSCERLFHMEVDWSFLPPALLVKVFEQLDFCSRLTCQSVCTAWLLVLTSEHVSLSLSVCLAQGTPGAHPLHQLRIV